MKNNNRQMVQLHFTLVAQRVGCILLIDCSKMKQKVGACLITER